MPEYRDSQPLKRGLYLIGAFASVVTGAALTYHWHRSRPLSSAPPDLPATASNVRADRPSSAPPTESSAVQESSATSRPETPAVSVSGALSDECLSLWSNLSVADLDHRNLTAADLSSLIPPGDCRSNSADATNALAAYGRSCAPLFDAAAAINENDAAGTGVVRACVNTARIARAWLGWQASDGKDLSEITDPLLLLDRLLVLAGDAGKDPATIRSSIPKLDASRAGEIAAISQRLLELAQTSSEREVAEVYLAASQPPAPIPAETAAPSVMPRAPAPVAASSATGDFGPVTNSTYQNQTLTNSILRQQQKGLSPDALGLGHTVPSTPVRTH